MTAADIRLYLHAVLKSYDENNPTEGYIFGCGETGFMFGHMQCQKVVGARGAHNVYQQQDGDQVNTTVLTTICAEGTCLKETVIYKAKKNFQQKWAKGN